MRVAQGAPQKNQRLLCTTHLQTVNTRAACESEAQRARLLSAITQASSDATKDRLKNLLQI